MSKSLDRSQRAGSDPLIIGSSKLATDSNNNLSVLDSSDAPKKLIASELEIGDSSSKVIIKKEVITKYNFKHRHLVDQYKIRMLVVVLQ